MDQIEKILRKLNKKHRKLFLLLMQQIERDYTKVPGLKMLSVSQNYFRVRAGRYRLIFEICKDGSIIFHRLSKRDDNTYKNL